MWLRIVIHYACMMGLIWVLLPLELSRFALAFVLVGIIHFNALREK